MKRIQHMSLSAKFFSTKSGCTHIHHYSLLDKTNQDTLNKSSDTQVLAMHCDQIKLIKYLHLKHLSTNIYTHPLAI